MPAWRDFTSAQLAALARVVDAFSEVTVTAVGTGQISLGSEVYQTHCAECHGDGGEGNGFAANSLPIPIMPTDFTRELLSEQAALRALREGINGTSMAPWGDRLSEQEMEAASAYVRSLFRGITQLAQRGNADD